MPDLPDHQDSSDYYHKLGQECMRLSHTGEWHVARDYLCGHPGSRDDQNILGLLAHVCIAGRDYAAAAEHLERVVSIQREALIGNCETLVSCYLKNANTNKANAFTELLKRITPES